MSRPHIQALFPALPWMQSAKGHGSCVAQLVELGANVNMADRAGRSALHRAVQVRPLVLVQRSKAGRPLDLVGCSGLAVVHAGS